MGPIARPLVAVAAVGGAVALAAWALSHVGHNQAVPSAPTVTIPPSDANDGAVLVQPGTPAPTPRPHPGTTGGNEGPPPGTVPTTAPALVPAPSLFDVHRLAAGYVTYDRELPAAATTASAPDAFNAMVNSEGPGWAAADATYSVRLPDGRDLWLFGDTLVNTVGDDGAVHQNGGFIRNSAIVQDGTHLTTLAQGTAAHPTSFLQPEDPAEWYWPGTGVVEGNTLQLFMGRVHSTGSGAWAFGGAGTDLVSLDLGDLSVQSVRHLNQDAHLTWGVATVDDDRYTYIYGMEGGDGPFDRWSHVARVPLDHVGDGTWEYWDGHGWSADASRSARLTQGVSNSFSVIRTRDGYAMVSQQLFFGTGLRVANASSPQGPFTDFHDVDPGPARAANQISYNALVHPEFDAHGNVLVSWNMNTNDGQLPQPGHDQAYRPVFRSIPATAFERPRQAAGG